MTIGQIDVRMAALKRQMGDALNGADARTKDDISKLKTEFATLQEQRNRLEADADARYTSSTPVINPEFSDLGQAETRTNTPVNGPYASGPEYRSMFPNADYTETNTLFGETRNGFESFAQFADYVASGRMDERLNTRAASGAVPSDGGFSMDVQYEQWLLDESLEGEIVRRLPGINIVGMTSRTTKIPAWNSADHSAGAVGGMIGYWTGENTAGSETIPEMNQRELHARKLMVLARSSLELIEDGLSYGQQLQNGMAATLGFYLDDAFINGDGVAKPQGILNAGCAIEVAKESGQGAATVVLQNISKMYSRMLPAAQRRAVWLAHPDVLPQLYQLDIAVGTGGSWVQPMREESGNFFLMGRPVIFTEHLENVGSAGDLAFFDPKSYAVGIREGSLRLDFSDHVGFTSAQRMFRSMIRVDGACVLPEAITLKDGSTTVSPVVTLAERS